MIRNRDTGEMTTTNEFNQSYECTRDGVRCERSIVKCILTHGDLPLAEAFSVGLGWRGWKPEVRVDGGGITKLTETLSSIQQTAVKFQNSPIITRLFANVDRFSTAVTEYFDQPATMFSALRDVHKVRVYLKVIVDALNAGFSVLGVFDIIMALYEIVDHVLSRLPAYLRRTLGLHLDEPIDAQLERLNVRQRLEEEERDVFFPANEFFSAEAGVDLLNLWYSALIGMLPKSAQAVLEAFQRYTGVRILRDIDWISDISAVILSIPDLFLQLLRKSLPYVCLSTQVSVVDNYIAKYNEVMALFPAASQRLISKEIRDLIDMSIEQENRHSVVFQTRVEDVLGRARDVIRNIQVGNTLPPPSFLALVAELKAVHIGLNIEHAKSRVEPVAILVCGSPGTQKTTFLTKLTAYLSQLAEHSTYHFTPHPNSKDFFDHYMGQTLFIHEDMGQTSQSEFANYVQWISSNPAQLDAAAADKKGTKTFSSQLILGTTNLPMTRKPLIAKDEHGFTDPEAIYRRFIIIDVGKDPIATSPIKSLYRYNLDTHIYEAERTLDLSNLLEVATYIRTQMQRKRDIFNEITSGVSDLPMCPLLTEGRKTVVNAQPVIIIQDQPISKVIFYLDAMKVMDVGRHQQDTWISLGYFINGARLPVDPFGEICVTQTADGFTTWLDGKMNDIENSSVRRIGTLFDDLRTIFELGQTAWIVAGIVTVGALAAVSMKMILLRCDHRTRRTRMLSLTDLLFIGRETNQKRLRTNYIVKAKLILGYLLCLLYQKL